MPKEKEQIYKLFKPQLTPKKMFELGVFGGSYFGKKIKGISFNSIGTNLGENLINNKFAKFDFGCSIKKDYFNGSLKPQLIIEDAMLVN